MTEWKDITNYLKGEEHVPRSWECKIGNMSILVTRRSNQNPDIWCWNCHEAGISDLRKLEHKETDLAKAEALLALFNILQTNYLDCYLATHTNNLEKGWELLTHKT